MLIPIYALAALTHALLRLWSRHAVGSVDYLCQFTPIATTPTPSACHLRALSLPKYWKKALNLLSLIFILFNIFFVYPLTRNASFPNILFTFASNLMLLLWSHHSFIATPITSVDNVNVATWVAFNMLSVQKRKYYVMRLQFDATKQKNKIKKWKHTSKQNHFILLKSDSICTSWKTFLHLHFFSMCYAFRFRFQLWFHLQISLVLSTALALVLVRREKSNFSWDFKYEIKWNCLKGWLHVAAQPHLYINCRFAFLHPVACTRTVLCLTLNANSSVSIRASFATGSGSSIDCRKYLFKSWTLLAVFLKNF